MSWWPRRRRRPVMPTRQAYDLWAATYGDGTNALQDLEQQATAAVLPDVGGLRVLDAGCGTGRWSRQLLERGAARVVGFDFSTGMLAEARRAGPQVPLLGASLEHGLPFRDGAFDAALCVLVLGHLPELERPLGELARVVALGGALVISGFHPYATLRGWQRTFELEGGRRGGAIEQHAHLLSDYVRLLGRGGLTLEALEEPCWQDSPVAFALRAVKRR